MISRNKTTIYLALALMVAPASPQRQQHTSSGPVMPTPAESAAAKNPAPPAIAGLKPHQGSMFDPPPPPDPPWLNDPPDFFDDPFTTNDLPDPWNVDFPPEDPFDLPLSDLPPLPDPPDFEDPIPDLPSEFPAIPFEDPFNDLPLAPLPPSPALLPFSVLHGLVSQKPAAVAANSPAKLMPFPMWLPFHPTYSGTPATVAPRKCDAKFATVLALPENHRNSVYFLNTCDYTHTRVIVGSNPAGVAATSDGQFLLVTNRMSGSISVVDLTAFATVATISLPSSFNGQPAQPTGIVITPDGTRAYATDHDNIPGSVVYVIDVVNRKFLSTIPVGTFPGSIAITPDGSQVWVPSRADNNITVIDTLTNAPILTIGNVSLPTGIAFNPTGTRAYVAEGIATGGALLVIDTATYSVTATIPVGKLPHTVAVTPTGHHVFVTNTLSDNVMQIDTSTNQVIRTIPAIGQHPLGIGFMRR